MFHFELLKPWHLPEFFACFLRGWVLFGIPALLAIVGAGAFFKPLRARHIRFSLPVFGLVFGLATGFFNAWDDHQYYSSRCQGHWYDACAILGMPGEGMANAYGGDWQEDEAWEYRADITILNGLFWLNVAVAGWLLLRFMVRHPSPTAPAQPYPPAGGDAGTAPCLAVERHWPGAPQPDC